MDSTHGYKAHSQNTCGETYHPVASPYACMQTKIQMVSFPIREKTSESCKMSRMSQSVTSGIEVDLR